MAPNTENVKKEVMECTDVHENKGNTVIKKQNASLKGSVVLDLGNYKAAVIPLIILVVVSIMLVDGVKDSTPHPLSEGKFLLDNSTFIFTLMYGYILFCTVWGPRMMKDREPIKMRSTIMYYNIFQVVVCIYMVYEFGMSGWFGSYNFHCEPLKVSNEPSEVRMSKVVYIYYLTKLLDLLDTVFFVLNKKWDNVSLLHLIHHSTMVLNLWFACLYIPRGHITFSMFINSFIHVVMYGYYYLASLGPAVRPYLWWKKYLTALQIIQLASIFLHAIQVYFNGCNVNYGLTNVSILCSFIYILLFLDFYLNSYRTQVKKSKSKPKIDMKENGSNDTTSSSYQLRHRNNLRDSLSTHESAPLVN